MPEPLPEPSGARAPSGDTARARIVGDGGRAVATVVLVRHGEAVCNTTGVVGGRRGCTGLTAEGRHQVELLAARLARRGELGSVGALYSSVLPRAVETAAILAPALDGWRRGPPLRARQDCDLCELHPGDADGLSWDEFAARFREPDWDTDPGVPIAPGGESWLGFVSRASGAVERLAAEHRGETVVVACHAGVIEATMLRWLPVRRDVARLGLRTAHASLTVWEAGEEAWTLQRYNDAAY
ncbi:MAG: histidine phosphatase family protein [Acidimicrobiales bacterium]